MEQHQINTKDALKYILAGNATVTLVEPLTKERRTFKVQEDDKVPGKFFVYFLSGSDNESDYTYLGMIFTNDGVRSFHLTKTTIKKYANSVPFKAFDWTFARLTAGLDPFVQIWHEGRCGRCGRKLTVPESILSGLGPECSKKGF